MVGVDAELRDDSEISAVSFGAQNAACLFVAGDGIVTVAEDVRLDPRERRRVAAQKILPGEEQRLCANAPRGAHRKPGRRVVWFFVDMDDLRTHFVDDSGKCGIIVKMELTVEPHRLNAECIAVGVRAFEWDDAALVAPERRDDDGELYIGLARQFFQFDLILPDDARFADHEDAHGAIIR